MLVQPVAALTPNAAAAVARALQDAEAARVAGLARRFTALARDRGVEARERHPPDRRGAFDAWIAEARTCGTAVIETFAAGLERDAAAVRAALTTLRSHAQAEGQITRLELIKRRSNGSAGFEPLRPRVSHAPLSTRHDEEPPSRYGWRTPQAGAAGPLMRRANAERLVRAIGVSSTQAARRMRSIAAAVTKC